MCAFTLHQPFLLSRSPLTLKCLKIPFMAQVICPPAGLGTRAFAELLSLLISVSGAPSFSCLSRLLHLCSCCASSVVSSLSCCQNSHSHSLSTWAVLAQSLSHAQLCVTMKRLQRARPLSIKYSQQEGWGGLPFLPQVVFPDSGMEPVSPALPGRFSSTVPPGEP